jgi:hypothetical protein
MTKDFSTVAGSTESQRVSVEVQGFNCDPCIRSVGREGLKMRERQRPVKTRSETKTKRNGSGGSEG